MLVVYLLQLQLARMPPQARLSTFQSWPTGGVIGYKAETRPNGVEIVTEVRAHMK